jgi:hypothetical protein
MLDFLAIPWSTRPACSLAPNALRGADHSPGTTIKVNSFRLIYGLISERNFIKAIQAKKRHEAGAYRTVSGGFHRRRRGGAASCARPCRPSRRSVSIPPCANRWINERKCAVRTWREFDRHPPHFVTRRRSAPLPLVGLSRCVRASGAMYRIDSPTLHWTWQFAGLAAEAHRQVGELARLTRTLAGVLHEAGGRRRNASSWRARSSPPSSKSVLSETRLRETIEVRPALGSWTPGGPELRQ